MNTQTPYNRPERVGHEILHIINDVAKKYIDLSIFGFCTFTKCMVTPDLKLAKIYFSVLSPKQTIREIEIGLNRKKKVFRKYLGQSLRIKNTPELKFYYDNTIEESNRINELLAKIHSNKDDL